MPAMHITKTEVDRTASADRDQLFWDTAVKGFGLKVTKNGARIYVVQYRTAGGRSGQTRRVTIGRHGSPWTAETARSEAKRILGKVAQGEDPAGAGRELRAMLTVAELCDKYLAEGTGTKKASTLASDTGRIERHIKPLLGSRKVSEITQADIRKFMKSVADGVTAVDVKTKERGRAIVKGGKGTASRTLGLLGGIFTFAVELGLIKTNPTHGVKRFPDKKNERFLSMEELGKVGEALRRAKAAGVNPKALTIIELLIYTGARRGEIAKLRWTEVDFAGRRLRLADSKTGQKAMPLNSAAMTVLTGLRDNATDTSGYVFPATGGEGHFTGTSHIWAALRSGIGMEDVRLHDLRHSFASAGVANGAPLAVVGALLGHSNHSTTQRYAHLANDPVAAASEAIGKAMTSAMQGSEGSVSNVDSTEKTMTGSDAKHGPMREFRDRIR